MYSMINKLALRYRSRKNMSDENRGKNEWRYNQSEFSMYVR